MSTAAAPQIRKTPGVCGGDACVRNTRIPVWLLVLARVHGQSDRQLLSDYPGLTVVDLDACWSYYREFPVEIEQAIWLNDTAQNAPAGSPPPSWVLVQGRLLGLSDDQIRETFDPPIAQSDLDAAWDAYRSDPARVCQDIATHRLAG